MQEFATSRGALRSYTRATSDRGDLVPLMRTSFRYAFSAVSRSSILAGCRRTASLVEPAYAIRRVARSGDGESIREEPSAGAVLHQPLLSWHDRELFRSAPLPGYAYRNRCPSRRPRLAARVIRSKRHHDT